MRPHVLLAALSFSIAGEGLLLWQAPAANASKALVRAREVRLTRQRGVQEPLDVWEWVIAEPGASCSETCTGGSSADSCSEVKIHYMDTEEELIYVGLSTGFACDTTLGMGWSEFPKIQVTDGHCSYRRPWTYPPSCNQRTKPRSFRYCKCGSTWYRSRLGLSCSETCRGRGVCDEAALEAINTVEKIKALALSMGFPCHPNKPIWAKEFPSQLGTGECAYTYGYQSTCDDNVLEGERRFCPCRVESVVAEVTTTTATYSSVSATTGTVTRTTVTKTTLTGTTTSRTRTSVTVTGTLTGTTQTASTVTATATRTTLTRSTTSNTLTSLTITTTITITTQTVSTITATATMTTTTGTTSSKTLTTTTRTTTTGSTLTLTTITSTATTGSATLTTTTRTTVTGSTLTTITGTATTGSATLTTTTRTTTTRSTLTTITGTATTGSATLTTTTRTTTTRSTLTTITGTATTGSATLTTTTRTTTTRSTLTTITGTATTGSTTITGTGTTASDTLTTGSQTTATTTSTITISTLTHSTGTATATSSTSSNTATTASNTATLVPPPPPEPPASPPSPLPLPPQITGEEATLTTTTPTSTLTSSTLTTSTVSGTSGTHTTPTITSTSNTVTTVSTATGTSTSITVSTPTATTKSLTPTSTTLTTPTATATTGTPTSLTPTSATLTTPTSLTPTSATLTTPTATTSTITTSAGARDSPYDVPDFSFTTTVTGTATLSAIEALLPPVPMEVTTATTTTIKADPDAFGDPHLTNIHGSTFDVLREGITAFLVFPEQEGPDAQQPSQLRVDASVEHPGTGDRCRGWFIRRIWVTGSLVGQRITIAANGDDLSAPDPVEVKIGRAVLRKKHDIRAFDTKGKYNISFMGRKTNATGPHVQLAELKLRVAGVELIVRWLAYRKAPNSLNFHAQHLGAIGGRWGGLLGSDSHTWVSKHDPNCRRSKLPHLVGAGAPSPLMVSASLA